MLLSRHTIDVSSLLGSRQLSRAAAATKVPIALIALCTTPCLIRIPASSNEDNQQPSLPKLQTGDLGGAWHF